MGRSEPPDPEGEYVDEPMDEGRCPGCGNERGNFWTVAEGLLPPVPDEQRAGCPECDHRDHPLAFHHEWKWERMSEEERREAERAAEREAGRMAEYQYSAAGISEAREP